MAAALKSWCQIKNPPPPVDAYLWEEHYCQISPGSNLKWLSLRLFWRGRPNQNKKNKVSSNMRSVPDLKKKHKLPITLFNQLILQQYTVSDQKQYSKQNLKPHRRRKEFVLRGLTTEVPRDSGGWYGEGVLLPSQLGGLGEWRKVRHQPKTSYGVFRAWNTPEWLIRYLLHFLWHIFSHIHIHNY